MGNFVGGAGQLVFYLLEHADEYTSTAAPRQWLFDAVFIGRFPPGWRETFPRKCCLYSTGGLVRI
jgi:hypothetical protein